MAIFTKYSKSQIANILQNFPALPSHDNFHAEGLTEGTVNTYYRITFIPEKKIFYLKVDEVNDLERLKNEILILKTLKKNQKKLSFGFPVPLLTKDSKEFLEFEHKFILVYHEVKGRSLPLTELKPKHIKFIGEKLHELHQIIPDERIADHRFTLSGIEAVAQEISLALLQKSPELLRLLQNEIAFLKQNEPKKMKQVLIHGDLFDDNILWIQNKCAGVIDYESAGLGSRLFDIAMLLNALCFENGALNNEKLQNFFAGYEGPKRLSKNDFKWLNFYLRLTALRVVLTRLRDFEFSPNPTINPENFRDYNDFLERLQSFQRCDPIDPDVFSD